MFLAAAGNLALLARLHFVKPVLQVTNAMIDQAPIFFQLGFAGAARANAPADAAEVAPHLPQARQRVFQLRQLDLQARLGGAGAGGEDVEYQFTAVKDFELRRFFQVADLRRRQIVVEKDHIGVCGLHLFLKLRQLPLADVGGGINFEAFLAKAADDRRAGGSRQTA